MSITDLTKGIYRRVYAGFLTGKRINAVSMEAEAWFWRCCAVADDFGNFQADPMILRSLAAPRREVTAVKVERWMGELVKADLISFFSAGGERYAHVVGWANMQPAGKNGKRVQRCPIHPTDPAETVQGSPGESKGIQIQAEVPSASDSDSDSDSDVLSSTAGASENDPPDEFRPAGTGGLDSSVDLPVIQRIFRAYPPARQVGYPVAAPAIQRAVKRIRAGTGPPPPDVAPWPPDDAQAWLRARVEAYAAAVRGQPQKFIPNPAKWFDEDRYADSPATWEIGDDGHGHRGNPNAPRAQGAQGTKPAADARRRDEAARQFAEPERELPIA